MNVYLARAVWAAVTASALVGLVMAVVLLRGDPTYLVQVRTRGGTPLTDPAPVSFAARVCFVTVLAVGLFLAGRRAVSDAGVDLRMPALIGYALFITDTVVSACVGRMFPAFYVNTWLVVLLLGIMYSESISALHEGRGSAPPWVIWGFCVLALAAKLVYSLFLCSPAGS